MLRRHTAPELLHPVEDVVVQFITGRFEFRYPPVFRAQDVQMKIAVTDVSEPDYLEFRKVAILIFDDCGDKYGYLAVSQLDVFIVVGSW